MTLLYLIRGFLAIAVLVCFFGAGQATIENLPSEANRLWHGLAWSSITLALSMGIRWKGGEA